MKKVSVALIMFLAIGAVSRAQQQVVAPSLKRTSTTARPDRCATVQYMHQLYKQAGITNADASFETWIGQKIMEKKKLGTLGTIINYQVPVIFHIVHQGTAVGTGDNLSQARIQSQLAQLNKDFANLSNSPYGVASTTGLIFNLAQTDPNGLNLAEPGIHRVNATTDLTSLPAPPYSMNDFDTYGKPNSIWNPAKYLNIWIAPLSGGILGYSTFPVQSGLPGLSTGETDQNAGVVVVPSSVGSLVTPNGSCLGDGNIMGKTLTHEMGHFFGLRHIWGDATCGTDYCDDTPIHQDANYGTFSHPKSNSCGTLDEMFENYMDYTDDVQLNTFTANQVDRMQVVMLNSPRRTVLANSSVGVVNFTSNLVAFVGCGSSLTESETGTTGDPLRYHDLKITIAVEDRASGPATLTIGASGTATSGVDYTLLTPTVSFATGEGSKEVVIRIWDDGIVEPSESVTLSYVISGTGVVASPTQQVFTVNITDDDTYTIAQSSITLLNQDFETSVSGWTTLSNVTNPVNGFTVGQGATGFTGNSAYISNNRSLGATAPNTYTIDDAPDGSLSVISSPLINATGLSNLKLAYKWKCVGEKDADGIWDYGTIMTAPSTNALGFTSVPGAPSLVSNPDVIADNYSFPASYNNSSFYLGFYWENDNNTGTQPPLAVDELVITADGKKIEQTVNSNRGNNVPASTKVDFTSVQDGEIITTITDATASIGTVSTVVLQAGTTQVNITTPKGTYKRSAKVIKITPQTTYTGTAKVTLYFTQAEISVWNSSRSQLKVMQVNDGVDLSVGVNNSNAKILTPTVDDQLTAKGYISYTVTVTGFSQFFVVEPTTALPVKLISFTAKPAAATIQLQWATANEINNKGFFVERSTDGANFSSLGFVNSKVTAGYSGNTDYAYTDANVSLGTIYYYRLKQQDVDGNFTYSPVRSASLAPMTARFNVFPNPASGSTRLMPSKNMQASVQLINQTGQILKFWPRQNMTVAGVELALPALPAGIYTLRLIEDANISTQKITIQ